MRLDHGTSGNDAVDQTSARDSAGVGRKTSTHSPPTRTRPKATEPPVAGMSPTCQWSFSRVTMSVMVTLWLMGLPLALTSVSYTHLRAHETKANLVCRLL